VGGCSSLRAGIPELVLVRTLCGLSGVCVCVCVCVCDPNSVCTVSVCIPVLIYSEGCVCMCVAQKSMCIVRVRACTCVHLRGVRCWNVCIPMCVHSEKCAHRFFVYGHTNSLRTKQKGQAR
jgi:hypothetical protein